MTRAATTGGWQPPSIRIVPQPGGPGDRAAHQKVSKVRSRGWWAVGGGRWAVGGGRWAVGGGWWVSMRRGGAATTPASKPDSGCRVALGSLVRQGPALHSLPWPASAPMGVRHGEWWVRGRGDDGRGCGTMDPGPGLARDGPTATPSAPQLPMATPAGRGHARTQGPRARRCTLIHPTKHTLREGTFPHKAPPGRK